MARKQNKQTVLRHLKELLRRAEMNDFTSMSEDEALRTAIAALAFDVATDHCIVSRSGHGKSTKENE